jgi:hypothetical protein
MCNYCRKLTQSAYKLREGYDVNTGYEGEAFIDLFNNLTIHLERPYASVETTIPIKYCPWCGAKLNNQVFKYADQAVFQEVLQPAT